MKTNTLYSMARLSCRTSLKMAHYTKQRSKIDTNQKAIVAALRKIPGITVAVNHDDVLLGYQGKTYWYEIKSENPRKKDGAIKKKSLKPSQIELLTSWSGHYKIVWSLDMILLDIGIE